MPQSEEYFTIRYRDHKDRKFVTYDINPRRAWTIGAKLIKLCSPALIEIMSAVSDGSIKVSSFLDQEVMKVLPNILPKLNSFFEKLEPEKLTSMIDEVLCETFFVSDDGAKVRFDQDTHLLSEKGYDYKAGMKIFFKVSGRLIKPFLEEVPESPGTEAQAKSQTTIKAI